MKMFLFIQFKNQIKELKKTILIIKLILQIIYFSINKFNNYFYI